MRRRPRRLRLAAIAGLCLVTMSLSGTRRLLRGLWSARRPADAAAAVVDAREAAAPPSPLRRALPRANKPAPPPEPAPRRRTARAIRMRVTAYCPCRRCCGQFADGKTASGAGVWTHGSRFVAADTRVLPFGTRVSVPGYHGGRPVPVLDRGGAIRGNRLDVFFLSHATARRWGVRWLTVTVCSDAPGGR